MGKIIVLYDPMKTIKKYDKPIALIFVVLTIVFIVLSMADDRFFHWIFERHQNPISWYIRPVFLIPFCFFAYKHSWAGISFTLFCLFTSMCWFAPPETVPDNVKAFLEFEKEWLYGTWDYRKTLLILTVPLSFIALGLAFWKRSLWMGVAVVIMMATGKITWSVVSAGETGKSIILPAILGLLLCVGVIYVGFRNLEKRKRKRRGTPH